MKWWRFGFVLLFILVVSVTIKRLIPSSPSFVVPLAQTYRTGEIFPMKIEVENVRQPINAVQVDLSYDPSLLEVLDVSTTGSFADIFLDKEIDNKVGRIKFSGGCPNPGFSENRGLFATVIFHARQAGPAEVKFLPSSQIILDDGKGTNVLKNYPIISLTISPEMISAEDAIKQREQVLGTQVLGVESEKEQIKLYEVK
jgi:hypothetical protein